MEPKTFKTFQESYSGKRKMSKSIQESFMRAKIKLKRRLQKMKEFKEEVSQLSKKFKKDISLEEKEPLRSSRCHVRKSITATTSASCSTTVTDSTAVTITLKAVGNESNNGKPSTLDIDWKKKMYRDLTTDITLSVGANAACTDKEALKRYARGDANLVYGEIGYDAFYKALKSVLQENIQLKSGCGIFYDLGSGTGKMVYAAAIVHSFQRCVGVELLGKLHRIAVSLKYKWVNHFKTSLYNQRIVEHKSGEINDKGKASDFSNADTDIVLIQSDFCDIDCSDADIIYTATTCFSESMMKSIACLVDNVKIGSIFISTAGKRLPSPKWKIINCIENTRTNWGISTLVIHQKVLY